MQLTGPRAAGPCLDCRDARAAFIAIEASSFCGTTEALLAEFLSSETGVANTVAIESNTKNRAVKDIRRRNREKITTKKKLAPAHLENPNEISARLNKSQFKTILSRWLKLKSRDIPGNPLRG